MKPKIYIRVDGSNEIGLGHLVRCGALAYMLRAEFDITFVCATILENILADLKTNSFSIYLINDESSFWRLLEKKDIVVLDGYNFDTEYQRKIKETGARLVCIDDLNRDVFYADLIISQSANRKPYDYKAQSYTKFALGLEFALLRPQFLEQTRNQRVINKLDTLFICFGGSDSLNLTTKTLELAVGYTKFNKIIVVTGGAYTQYKTLAPLIDNDNRIEYHCNVNAEKMVSLLIESNLAIAPSSSVLLEIFAVGVPVITGYYVDNQKDGSDILSKMGYAVSCGNMQLNYSYNLKTFLDDLNVESGYRMVQKQKTIKWGAQKSLLNLFNQL